MFKKEHIKAEERKQAADRAPDAVTFNVRERDRKKIRKTDQEGTDQDPQETEENQQEDGREGGLYVLEVVSTVWVL